MLKVSIPEKDIQRALNAIKTYKVETQQKIKDQVLLSAYAIQKKAKEKCPVDEGVLRNNIVVEPTNNGFGAGVGTHIHYAPHVEFGTAPHVIRVKNKKALSNGKIIFGKKVNHPGTKAQPFLYPAWEEERVKFIDKAGEILKSDKAKV